MAEEKGRACKIAVKREKGRDWPCRAVEPRERDVRREGARLGGNTDAHEALVDLAVERSERCVRFDPRPERVRAALPLEYPDPGNARRDRGGVEDAERCGDIFCAVAVDLADEAQREMELFVALPARRRQSMHRAKELGANGARRAEGDEQAVLGHGAANIGAPPRWVTLARPHFPFLPVSLESRG